jgi:hypothetical protein
MDDLIEKLNRYGWTVSSPEALDFVKAAYAVAHGLSSHDQVAEHLELPRFCNHPDVMPLRNSVCKWPDPDITWCVVPELTSIGSLPRQAVIEGIEEALARWARVCGIKPQYTPGNPRARIVVGSRYIDGSYGVLAESELPCGNVAQCRQWYDTGDSFAIFGGRRRGKTLDFIRIAAHELGHALGLGHIGAGNLLAPTYSDEVEGPQSGDIAEMQMRYGKPVTSPSPEPPSPIPNPPTGDEVVIRLSGKITIDGWRLTKLK